MNYNIDDSLHSPGSQAEENAGRNSKMNDSKKDLRTFDFGSNSAVWLPGLVDVDNILPGSIDGYVIREDVNEFLQLACSAYEAY